MDSYPVNSFFTNFTNLFNRIEKTEDTPALSSFHSLSEQNNECQNISFQKPHTVSLDNDSHDEQDLSNAIEVSGQINSGTTSETAIQLRDESNNPNNLDPRSSLEKLRNNNAETNIDTSKDRKETHTENKFLDTDLPVNVDQASLSSTCQDDQRLANDQAILLSEPFGQLYNDPSRSNTAPNNHRCDLSDLISKQKANGLPDTIMKNNNTTNITKEEESSTARYDGENQTWTHDVKHMQISGTQEPSNTMEIEDLYPHETKSTNINDAVSAAAFSDQADYSRSTFKSNLVIPAGEIGTKTKCTHSDTGNNQIKPKEEFWSSAIPDTCNRCHVESDRQLCSETGDPVLKVKSDPVLVKLEPTIPDSHNETQKEGGPEVSKLEIVQSGSDGLIQTETENGITMKNEDETDILQESLDIPTVTGNLEVPLITETASRSTKRVTFSPDLKLEKPPQLSSIFSGLKGFKKETQEQQKKAETFEQPKSPVLTKPASVKRALFSEKHFKSESKGSILEQLSQLLSFDASKVGAKKTQDPIASPPLSPSSELPEEEIPPREETVEAPDAASSGESGKITNTETTLNAFKAFFTPKLAKRNTSDHIDLDAVKRAFNPETIRAIFDKSPNKSPENRNSFDKAPENEERTPGRLQAVWPPPKTKDEEDKIGLKYTEADKYTSKLQSLQTHLSTHCKNSRISDMTKSFIKEHQAALLHLKREFKEENEALEAGYKLQLYQLREENEVSGSRLQTEIADLKKAAKCSHGELRDAAVSTEDCITPRSFRTVCIQTDRETFIKPSEKPELRKGIFPQPNVPKKLDIESITHSLVGKQEPEPLPLLPLPLPPPPPPPPPPVQSGFDPSPSLPGPSETYSIPAQSDNCPALTQANGPPPPPPPPLPPPPTIRAGLPLTGGGLLRAEERQQRKPRLEPVCPMKPLYWTRIQIKDNRNDTLWNMLEEPAIINTNEFAELFAKMASPAKRKPLSEAYDKAAKAKKIIKVLDSKRSQAVGILISSLHLEMKDIQQAILMMDNSVVDMDAIEALYENRAQPEELAKIRKHYETTEHVKLLDKPEQFLYELSLIPQFSLRARCIIFQTTFTDVVASIQHKASMVFNVCKGLLEKDSVKEVLGLVLAFGNYMNGGSRHRGQADGFDLEILPKLKDVKSRNNRMSLVDYIVSYYLHNIDENAGTENCVFPLPEPQDVFFASQVKFEDLSKELRKLGKDLESCEKDVQRVWITSSQEFIYPFKEKMEAFISNALKEKIETEHHLINAQNSFHDLVQYFGLKPRSGEQNVQPSHIFMLWFEFCNDFKTRWKRENRTISNERLKEAQQTVRNITADKKVETRQVNANGLKERLRQKEASLSST